MKALTGQLYAQLIYSLAVCPALRPVINESETGRGGPQLCPPQTQMEGIIKTIETS